MSKIKKLVFSFLGITVLTFSACNVGGNLEEPEVSPEEMVRDAMVNWVGVNTVRYEMSMTELVSAETDEQEVRISFDATGVSDGTNPAEPKFSLDGNFELGMGAESYSGAGEVVFDGSDAYLLLSEAPEDEQVKAFIDPFVGKWWRIANAKDYLGDLPVDPFNQQANEEMEVKMKAFFEENSLFTNLEYLGSEQAGGVASHHYSGQLDKEVLKDLLELINTETASGISAEEKAQMEEAIDQLDVNMELWISPEDLYFRKIVANFVMNMSAEGENLSADVDVTMEMFDINENLTVEVPAEYEDFNPAMLLGPMMMGSGALEGTEGLKEMEEVPAE